MCQATSENACIVCEISQLFQVWSFKFEFKTLHFCIFRNFSKTLKPHFLPTNFSTWSGLMLIIWVGQNYVRDKNISSINIFQPDTSSKTPTSSSSRPWTCSTDIWSTRPTSNRHNVPVLWIQSLPGNYRVMSYVRYSQDNHNLSHIFFCSCHWMSSKVTSMYIDPVCLLSK